MAPLNSSQKMLTESYRYMFFQIRKWLHKPVMLSINSINSPLHSYTKIIQIRLHLNYLQIFHYFINIYHILQVPSFVSTGIHLESTWNPPGIHLESTWKWPGLIQMDWHSTWNPPGIQLESNWTISQNCRDLAVKSTWNPPGIHLESTWSPLDSTWNTMATGKTSCFRIKDTSCMSCPSSSLAALSQLDGLPELGHW